LDLTVEKGEMMAIIGNSGSGKSTLLNILGGLDRPSAGKLLVDGKELLKFDDKSLIKYNRETIGFVWQNNARNLIPYLSALQNVQIPMILDSKRDRKKRAKELLEMVGLGHRMNNSLNQLSGGEQQRVAIAIAISNNPKILLADEPTGAVDTKTTESIMELFRNLNRVLNITIVIVTHDRQISKAVNRVVAIRDGRTSSEFIRKKHYTEEMQEMEDAFSTEQTHDELLVMDKAGRIQIPHDSVEAIGLNGNRRLKLVVEENRLVLYPAEEEKKETSL
jgi:ABC-type lipoprotein export system ATPase subunit